MPGINAVSKDDDDWFSLDTLPEDPFAAEPSPTSIPSAVMPFADNDWESDEDADSPESAARKVAAQTTPNARVKNPAARSDEVALDAESRPAPEADGIPHVPVGDSASKAASVGRSVFDDDLPDLAPLPPPTSPAATSRPAARSDTAAAAAIPGSPLKSQPKPSSSKTGNPKTGTPKTDTPKPNAPKTGQTQPGGAAPAGGSAGPNAGKLQGSLEQLSRDEAALQAYFQPPAGEEFSFPCKICGTLLEVAVSRVGKRTHCPDCHSEVTVPARPAKKKVVEMRLDESVADVKLSPVEGASRRNDALGSTKTKEILDKAAVDLQRERQEIDPVSVAFDSKRWMQLIFGFLRDPGLIIAAVILGLFTAVWMYAIHAVGKLELSMMHIVIVRGLIFGLLCIPILGSIVMCALAIIPMAANQKNRVEDWPFGRFFDSIGEFLMVVVALALASVPGGILASGVAAVGGSPFIGAALIMLSIWGITPILLLGMIDNGQVVNPFSKSVLQSISAKPEAWGAMYFQSGFAYVLLLILLGVARMTGPVSTAVLGALLPLSCFFIANQYGVLAGRISDVTELGYEGDFSED